MKHAIHDIGVARQIAAYSDASKSDQPAMAAITWHPPRRTAIFEGHLGGRSSPGNM